MTRSFRVALGVTILAATFAAGAISASSQKEPHPALQRAIDQIGNIKTHLANAPKDFGGHKQKAIDALSIATDELHQAMAFDSK